MKNLAFHLPIVIPYVEYAYLITKPHRTATRRCIHARNWLHPCNEVKMRENAYLSERRRSRSKETVYRQPMVDWLWWIEQLGQKVPEYFWKKKGTTLKSFCVGSILGRLLPWFLKTAVHNNDTVFIVSMAGLIVFVDAAALFLVTSPRDEHDYRTFYLGKSLNSPIVLQARLVE